MDWTTGGTAENTPRTATAGGTWQLKSYPHAVHLHDPGNIPFAGISYPALVAPNHGELTDPGAIPFQLNVAKALEARGLDPESTLIESRAI